MMPGPPPRPVVHTPYYRNYVLSGPSRLSRGPPDFPEPEKPPIGAIPASTIANEEDVLKVLRPILMNEDPGGSVAEDNCSESLRGAFSTDRRGGHPGPMSVSMNPECVRGKPLLEQFIAGGHPYVAELAHMRDREIVELPTGHWPQLTKPHELAAIIETALG